MAVIVARPAIGMTPLGVQAAPMSERGANQHP